MTFIVNYEPHKAVGIGPKLINVNNNNYSIIIVIKNL